MRGKSVDVGATRVAQNGYHYTKVEVDGKGKWRLTHHIIAEKKLGRPLREDERVTFIGSRRDLSPDNIRVIEKGRSSVRRRLAQVEARLSELTAERDELQKELVGQTKVDHSR